jgi:hypothetical protein
MGQTVLFFLGLLISSLTSGQILKLQGGTSISQLDWTIEPSVGGKIVAKTCTIKLTIGYRI